MSFFGPYGCSCNVGSQFIVNLQVVVAGPQQVTCFDNSQWPGYSPDLNVCENLGAILKDRVEESLSNDPAKSRSSKDGLLEIIEEELHDMSDDTELLQTLLKSYPARLEAVKNAGGYHTKY